MHRAVKTHIIKKGRPLVTPAELTRKFPILAAPGRQPEHDAAAAAAAANRCHTPASRRLPSRPSRPLGPGDKTDGKIAVATIPATDWNGLASCGDDVEVDEVDKLKSKLMAAWNNVKHGWVVKTKTSFSRHSPIYLLGKQYDCCTEDAATGGGASAVAVPAGLGPAFREFRRDFASRIWLTYRREFPQLGGSGWTTDTGWGCMLRSGQMLLAQGLLHHLLGRDWQSEEALHLLHQESEASSGRLSSSPGESDYVMVGRGYVDDSIASRLAGTSCTASTEQTATYRQILGWFTDAPNSPFGVHKLVEFGKSSGKRAGDWYGPAIVAHILKKAIEEAEEKLLKDTVVYVAQDCTVYVGDVQELCQPKAAGSSCGSNEDWGLRRSLDERADGCGGAGGGRAAAMPAAPGAEWKALFVLVPVRLGGETLNPVYIGCVKGILEMESCIGIIGGKPKHSLYFIGYQDDHVIYLDPHYSQPVVDTGQPNFPVESFHCCSPRKTAFTKIDPSCTLGFYCRTRDDFVVFQDRVIKVLRPSAVGGGGGGGGSGGRGSLPQDNYPIFSFVSGRSRDVEDEEPKPERHVRLRSVCHHATRCCSSEDFVLL